MKSVQIKDIGRVVTGKTPATAHPEYYGGDILFVTPPDMISGFVIRSTERTITDEGLRSIRSNSINGRSILVSCIGDIGRVAITESTCATNQQINAITDINDDLYDAWYVYYKVSTLKDRFFSCAGCTVVPILAKSAFEEIEIPDIPFLDEQKKISNVLFSIDRKIALNRKRIATLEAMAKEIYDYWFVQFDFPDAHGRPYKSSGGAMVYNPDLKREIPKGWEVCRIGDHITANRGISYSTKNISSGNGVPMINLNSFNVDSSYKVKGIKMFDGEIPSTRRIAPYDLVMCNTQQTDLDPCKDIIGKSFLVPDIFEGTIVSSHHVTTIHVDDDNLKVYLNALFHTREFHAYIAGYASGTSIRGLNFLGVENCYIAVPHMPLLSKFANLALSCEKEKSRILRNQKMLQTLRDFILPLLMNGQVKVG